MDSQKHSKPLCPGGTEFFQLPEVICFNDGAVKDKQEAPEYSVPESAKAFIMDDLKDGQLGRGTAMLFKEIYDATYKKHGPAALNKLMDEINERQILLGNNLRLAITQDLTRPKGQPHWRENTKLNLNMLDDGRGRLSSVIIYQEVVENPFSWKSKW